MKKKKLKTKLIRAFAIVLGSVAFLSGCSQEKQTAQETTAAVPLKQTNSEIQKEPLENADYEKIMALKKENYENMPVKEFNAFIADQLYDDGNGELLNIYTNMFDRIQEGDQDYDFIFHTLNLTNGEIYSDHSGDLPYLDVVSFQKIRESNEIVEGEPLIDFLFFAPTNIHYVITDNSKTTVGERDKRLSDCRSQMQEVINRMSEEELKASDIKETLNKEFDKIIAELSDHSILLEYTIEDIECLDNEN